MAITRELKSRWLERLRDPNSKHARGRLKNIRTGGMCCLGHLADLQGHLTEDGFIDVEAVGYDPKIWKGSGYLCNARKTDKIIDVPLYGLSPHIQSKLSEANDELNEFPIELIEKLKTKEDYDKQREDREKKKAAKSA